MKYLLGLSILVAITSGLFLFLPNSKQIEIPNLNNSLASTTLASAIASSTPPAPKNLNIDEPPQKPLQNPPAVIKAVYATAWSAGNDNKVNYLTELIKNTELNAVVIDIKDYSGYVLYDIKSPLIEEYNAKEIRILKINKLIKQFHDEGIYVIARMTVFQDPVLAKARPDLAIHSKVKCQLSNVHCGTSSSTLWLDNKKLAWIDPAAKSAWDYDISIAKDAASRGFDEINFDYIRFASDGSLKDMVFPFYNSTSTYKSTVIKNFFKYLRSELMGVKISADLFGLSTVNADDLGIGQIIESAYAYFDYVSPMVYPSHYATGFLGYKNPANYPYEVVKYSMDHAAKRLSAYGEAQSETQSATSTANMTSSTTTISDLRFAISPKLRPWLQDFNLGATYTAEMVRNEIQAVYDAASSTPELLNGFMLWNPSNIYTKGALKSNTTIRMDANDTN